MSFAKEIRTHDPVFYQTVFDLIWDDCMDSRNDVSVASMRKQTNNFEVEACRECGNAYYTKYHYHVMELITNEEFEIVKNYLCDHRDEYDCKLKYRKGTFKDEKYLKYEK